MGVLATSLIALSAPEAHAQEAAEASDAAAGDEGFRLDVLGGVKGGLTGAWNLEVPTGPEQTFVPSESKSYYPAFGLGGDIGLSVGALALGIVGLETGVRFSFDNAEGYNDLEQAGSGDRIARINQEQRTSSLRLPLLLKVARPVGTVKPTFGIGFEFVRQLDSTIGYDIEDNRGGSALEDAVARKEERNQIEATNYTALTLALGIEIDLGPVRIPIELRAQYNLNYAGESFEERVRMEGSGSDAVYYYDGQYQGHFGVSIGVIYDHMFHLK